MGMVTYDGLNGASAQSCKTDRLTVSKVPCLSRQSIAGQIIAGTCIYICEALRDCFTFISRLKASINSLQVSVNLLRLVLGRNVNGNAVKMLMKNYSPATLSPTGDVAPNEGCITVFFSYK